jgi:hypothetical protein
MEEEKYRRRKKEKDMIEGVLRLLLSVLQPLVLLAWRRLFLLSQRSRPQSL